MFKILDIKTVVYRNYCLHMVEFLIGYVKCKGVFEQYNSENKPLKEIISSDVMKYGINQYLN